MNMVLRNKDMLLGDEDLETLYIIEQFPIYAGTTSQREDQDKFADMEWAISQGSGMLQLKKLLATEEMYNESHNSSTGRVWEQHHRAFAQFLHKHNEEKLILEIGGGNGILNKLYNEMYESVPWIIVEPSNVMPVENCNAEYVRGKWGNKLVMENLPPIHNIVHSHFFEHLYDLNEFMKDVSDLLDTGAKMIFTLPNLKKWLINKYTNALFFEHTYFISEDYVDYILAKYGFKVCEKSYFNEHSIFYAAEKVGIDNESATCNFKAMYQENKKLFLEFITYYENLVREINECLKGGKNAYLFGAHIFSQYLLKFGLRESLFQCILDNDPLKQGKRLYGTSLQVSSPKILKDIDSPIVVLKAGAYTDEIKRDILENINSSTIFIE